MIKKASTLTIILTLFSSTVLAHFPILDCSVDKTTKIVNCFAGYSDGTFGRNNTVLVIGYDENELMTLKTNGSGTVSFTKPEAEFYIRFDPGHELPSEFDYHDL